MAGIEKVCEYSGEYVGWPMYSYKHNCIQVLPKYRKLFRGKYHEFEIIKTEKYWEHQHSYSPYNSLYEYFKFKYNDDTIKEFEKWYSKTYKARIVIQYEYILTVPDVPGNVNGKYYNHTYNLTATKRKLKRILRAQKLNII